MPKILSERDKVLKCKYGVPEKQTVLMEGKKGKEVEENIIVTQSCIKSLGEKKQDKWSVKQVECRVEKPEDCDTFKIGKKVSEKK